MNPFEKLYKDHELDLIHTKAEDVPPRKKVSYMTPKETWRYWWRKIRTLFAKS